MKGYDTCFCTEAAVVAGCSIHDARTKNPVSRHCQAGDHGKCPGYALVERPGVFRTAEWCGCSCGCSARPVPRVQWP